jgi:formate dehydrogenase major subunit
MAQVQIHLNGKEVAAKTEQTILEVATAQGISIPTLCNDKRLKPFGSCRVCLVKVEGARNFVPACSTNVVDGMVIDTESVEVTEARKLSLALLISDHYGDCVSPCSIECPAHIDIQGYIALIRANRYQEAVGLIKEQNPMPVTIGRICPHPCEEVCRRNRVDEPIAINNLKRFAADYDIALEHPVLPEKQAPTGKRVAVIGSGPAGLSAAYYLALLGHGVSIFERNERPGGMLRYGIPEYRLPKEILDREIDLIRSLGVEIRYATTFGSDITTESLRNSGFDALFLSIGAVQSTSMRIEGEDLSEVLSGIDFLAEIASGQEYDMHGMTVVVVGGGNTAMDASRTSLRLGAERVIVLYRRTRREMPAHDFE